MIISLNWCNSARGTLQYLTIANIIPMSTHGINFSTPVSQSLGIGKRAKMAPQHEMSSARTVTPWLDVQQIMHAFLSRLRIYCVLHQVPRPWPVCIRTRSRRSPFLANFQGEIPSRERSGCDKRPEPTTGVSHIPGCVQRLHNSAFCRP